jgi:hypothetical protein
MMTEILGNDDDQTVNEYILGFMTSIFPPTVKPLVKFNYSQYLVDNMHHQLYEFEASRYFRYQSYLVYLFVFLKLLGFNILK